MTKDEALVLHTLERKVRQLIEDYRTLECENQELYVMVDARDTEIVELKRQMESARKDYLDLKLARMLEVNAQDIDVAKKKVASLIREIDKCIALLNL